MGSNVPQLKRLGALAVTLIVLAGCGQITSPATPTPTPTPSRPGPALVQVENSVLARPLSGLQHADIVYEYLAEGGITRMTVIFFNPSGTERIEPVRSARPITLLLQKSYQGVIFFSGASSKVLGQIRDQQIPALSEGSDGGVYFARDPQRRAPHNLYTDGDRLRQGLDKHAPRVTYQLPPSGSPPASPSPAPASRIDFRQTSFHRVTDIYSPAENAYTYVADGSPLMDTDTGHAIKPVNVIVIQVAHHDAGFTDVLGAPAQAFDLQGTGKADVFSRGHHFAATWDLSTPDQPVRYLGADGKPIRLPQGLTWVYVVDPGTTIAFS